MPVARAQVPRQRQRCAEGGASRATGGGAGRRAAALALPKVVGPSGKGITECPYYIASCSSGSRKMTWPSRGVVQEHGPLGGPNTRRERPLLVRAGGEAAADAADDVPSSLSGRLGIMDVEAPSGDRKGAKAGGPGPAPPTPREAPFVAQAVGGVESDVLKRVHG